MLLKEMVDGMKDLNEVELGTLIDFAFIRKFSLQENRENRSGYRFQFTEKYTEGDTIKPCINKLKYNKHTGNIDKEIIHNDIIAKSDNLTAVTLSFYLRPGEVIERQMVRHYGDMDPEVLHVYYTVDIKGNLILIAHNEDEKNISKMNKYLRKEITLDNLLNI